MPQTMFHPSCEEPLASTAVTCENLCDKLSLCTAGLCAEQTGIAETCDSSVAASIKASCLLTCDESSLQQQTDEAQCLFENTCADVFLEQVCGPENTINCAGLPPPSSGTSQGETGQSTTCPFEDDGKCDEPQGTGLCPQDSDPSDCDELGTSSSTSGGSSSSGDYGGSSSGSTGWFGSSGSSGSTGGSSTSF